MRVLVHKSFHTSVDGWFLGRGIVFLAFVDPATLPSSRHSHPHRGGPRERTCWEAVVGQSFTQGVPESRTKEVKCQLM